MKLKSIVTIAIFAAVILLSCQVDKEDLVKELTEFSNDNITSDSINPITGFNLINGSVILPQCDSTKFNNLTISSIIDKNLIKADSFSIKTQSDQNNFLFVTNDNDEIILMAYDYLYNRLHKINAESTLIALSMLMPISSTLTDSGKTDLINAIKLNNNYENTIKSLEKLIASGLSPLDTIQTNFKTNFLSLFDRKIIEIGTGKDIPGTVNILQSKDHLIFQNTGKFYSNWIGIYYMGKQVDH